MGVSYRCADLRFDAQRTTKHQIDGCPIFTTIFGFDVALIISGEIRYINRPNDYVIHILCLVLREWKVN